MTYTHPTSTRASSTTSRTADAGRGDVHGSPVRARRGAAGRAVPRAGARQARVWSRCCSSSCCRRRGARRPWIAPDDPNRGQPQRARCSPPVWHGGTWSHPLGTDWQGYDMLVAAALRRAHLVDHRRRRRRCSPARSACSSGCVAGYKRRAHRPLADGLGRRAGLVPRAAAGDAADRPRRRQRHVGHGRSSPSTAGWSTPG